jgi:hypothetical protein
VLTIALARLFPVGVVYGGAECFDVLTAEMRRALRKAFEQRLWTVAQFVTFSTASLRLPDRVHHHLVCPSSDLQQLNADSSAPNACSIGRSSGFKWIDVP